MVENITNTQFHRVHLFIGEGQVDEALAALEQIQPANQKELHEIAYLRAWCYSERNNWEEAARLLPDAGASEEVLSDIEALGQTERRRRAHYQLLMGHVAVQIGHYEEAMRHYRRCIKFLDERRMNIPDVRIKAVQAMGTLSVLTGFYDMALVHYEEVLQLCGDNQEHPALPDAYYGLCNAYRKKGDFPRALEYGRKALQLYIERKEQHMIGRMRNQLGRICFQMRDFQTASVYYTEALALSTLVGSHIMSLNNLNALADLRREEGELGEAWRYCEMAQEYSTKLPPDTGPYMGMMYIVCGKVKEAEAKTASALQAKELLGKALTFYEQAIEVLKATDAKAVLREAYQRLAQALEESGKQSLAMGYWKQAYSASPGSEDSSPF